MGSLAPGADTTNDMTAARWSFTRHCLVGLAAVSIAATTACGPAATRPTVRPSPFPRAAGVSDDTTMPRPVAAPAPAPSLAARHLLDTAVGLRGVSYRLGGEDPGSGFDCSGFVRYVFAQHHVVLPRTVAEQFGAAHDIAPDEIAAGDLLFFSTIAPGPTHVGIALGPLSQGEFVHAPGTGSAVRVERFDTPYWQARFVGAKRTSLTFYGNRKTTPDVLFSRRHRHPTQPAEDDLLAPAAGGRSDERDCRRAG